MPDEPNRDPQALDEIVWRWDPLGVAGARPATEDEYSCIADLVLAALHRGTTPDDLRAELEVFMGEHFGMPGAPVPEAFVQDAVAWWQGRPSG